MHHVIEKNENMIICIWSILGIIYVSLQNEYVILGAFEVVNDDSHSHNFNWNFQNDAKVEQIWSHFDNISIF